MSLKLVQRFTPKHNKLEVWESKFDNIQRIKFNSSRKVAELILEIEKIRNLVDDLVFRVQEQCFIN